MTDISVHGQPEFNPDEASPLPERADFSESNLLARMSHEMRTPLSAILGFAQLMESCTPSPTDSQKRSLELILQAGWHLEKLIDMTRDLALLQSGALSLSLDPVPLAAVMLDSEALIEPQAQMRGIRVIFPRIERPCFVLADEMRLQQVLGNLLAAAIGYSEPDAEIIVHCDTRGSECIRISIGEGDQAFSAQREKFISRVRAGVEDDATTTRETGIGLLLARRLVESMGGTTGADTTVGAGKIFSFDLKRMLIAENETN